MGRRPLFSSFPPAPPGTSLHLQKIKKPSLRFYRYLYNGVGGPHMWVERNRMSDKILANIIHKDTVEIYVFYKDGIPAGYVEFNFEHLPRGELILFGLMPEFLGQGFGKFFMGAALRVAWNKPLKNLFMQTCTLDHMRALPLYRSFGFRPYARKIACLDISHQEMQNFNAEVSGSGKHEFFLDEGC